MGIINNNFMSLHPDSLEVQLSSLFDISQGNAIGTRQFIIRPLANRRLPEPTRGSKWGAAFSILDFLIGNQVPFIFPHF